ncbi:MAG: hypothetical protein KAT32_04525 [Candidatus Moranbacteria bacterium]|nr:hypothetical protein [Candidatus Moranbacteria bacterium]
MQEKKFKITIKKPIDEVFTFTTNPKNTHLWVPFVDEEVANEFPLKLGTIYKSRRKDHWNESRVTEYKINNVFKLENKTFLVKYTYKKIKNNQTELTYLESVKQGKLTNSFTQDVLEKLKLIIET